MKGGKVVIMLVLVVVFLGLCESSSASDGEPQKWWQSIFSGSGATSSVVNPVGSSVVFPLHGNVYPNGFYYVQLNIGEPPKPYFLDPDTGSDITWVQCDAPCDKCTEGSHPLYKPNNNLVICRDPLCAALHSSEEYNCDYPDQCDYEVEYADDGYSIGVLVKDAFLLNLTNGERHSPHLAFGCGYNQQPGASYHPLDGVLGLGKGKSTIVSQLHSQRLMRNVVGHCLSGQGGGFFFFGDGLYDSSRVVWTPMPRDYPDHYSPGFAEFIFGGKTTGYKNLLVIFDSGSSFSYLNSQAYQALISLVTKELTGKPLEEAVDDQTLPFCWKGRKPFKNIRNVRRYFKPLALSFANGWKSKSHFEIPPEGYLIISSKGNVCLGILNGTEIGINFNIIGDISMQDKMVIYDNEKQMIGWAHAYCDRIPKSKIDII